MQYYYEYLIYPFIVTAATAVGWVVWKLATGNHKFMPNKDPRWKNRNKIVDFVFAAFTVYSTLIIAIIGGITL